MWIGMLRIGDGEVDNVLIMLEAQRFVHLLYIRPVVGPYGCGCGEEGSYPSATVIADPSRTSPGRARFMMGSFRFQLPGVMKHCIFHFL